MPCDTIQREKCEQEKRASQLKALGERLKTGRARIQRNGSMVSIEGWAERAGGCDACAIRALRQSTDFQIRLMVARAVPNDATDAISFGHGH